ncbi:cell 5A endo-1,4-betaglucanase [Achlya hypogyna]|uniref:Cell 5A endo-1,4-betaglucanase n=1 Tax=Achlya hypogyna TaxID=1202772 RepID=A0A1V9Z248_ACHHY|nr:cell 5A endo-1,4-betaglucanase [Achlya hypogyna]
MAHQHAHLDLEEPSSPHDDGSTYSRGESFSYSQGHRESSFMVPSAARASIATRSIVAAPVESTGSSPKKQARYNGRLRRWPGVLLLACIVGGAIAAIAYGATTSSQNATARVTEVQKRLAKERAIADGLSSSSGSSADEVSEDGQINNPQVYPPAGCQLPDYQSKKGRIYAVAKNGTEIPVQIKGVNWFGMETGMQSPFGLWDNDHNGTTVYAVAKFLSDNKFNSVRIPLCVENILKNKALEASVINRVSNRALDLTSYISLLQTIVEALAYRQISVMISMHTLDIKNAAGSLWYGKGFSEKDFLDAIDKLTKALCSDKYWNVLGIDVKNEPWEGSWGTGKKDDFKVGAELIGKQILKGCPNWLVFVEGINAQNTITLDGEEYGYYDWFGGGLQKAGDYPIELPKEHKLVYAPHYYNPAVFPQYYLFGGGKVGPGNAIVGYVELPDDKLQGRVEKTMHQMFGYLNEKQDSAVLLGEFAGLYSLDQHPKKTTQRCTDYTVKTIRWPGILLLLVIIGGTVAAIVYFSTASHQSAATRMYETQKRLADLRRIKDGLSSGSGSGVEVPDHEDEDGIINNPKVYPPTGCQLPDYQSKKGRIYAVAKNGTEVALQIKGVNWFGMETGDGVPFGLWENDNNGTTVTPTARDRGSFSYSERGSLAADVPIRPSLVSRDIPAIPENEKLVRRNYSGRRRVWPGVLLLLFIIGGSIAAIAYMSTSMGQSAQDRVYEVQKALAKNHSIQDGLTSGSGSGFDIVDHVDDDGMVNNPKVYPPTGCQLPDYQSKNGRIVAVAKNGTEIPIQIKGVNWFGMETGMQAPFGLWDNDQNGTTVYEIARFLATNKYNSVRIPLCVDNILKNKPLEASIVNRVTNRALDLSSYLGLLQSVSKSLAYRQVSVMLSMHTLDITNSQGSLWYSAQTSVDDFLKSIDMLTAALCSDTYWNVLGIDVKNEPSDGTWGTGLQNDFKLGAELIGARILKGCPKWMVFVEGVNSQHSISIDGQVFKYSDWFGGGLQKAGDYPISLPTAHKLVYAPHYYNPAVFPQYYLFGGGTVVGGNAIANYVELSDDTLRNRVAKTMHHMFGYLNDKHDSAVVLGEFAGLYTKDAHPLKTTQRCTKYTVETMLQENYAGGYMWSLNPESAYQYNPADKPGTYTEGLLQDDWRQVNVPFLEAMKALDVMPDLKMMPSTTDASAPTPVYRGRRVRWPGVLLLVVLTAGAAVAMVHFGNKMFNNTQSEMLKRKEQGEKEVVAALGNESGSTSGEETKAVYLTESCQLPDYQSKKGRIYAVAKNGTEVAIQIKGVNWFGMETGVQIPLGLWDNARNGTTLNNIARFLQENKFNSVRLPLCVDSILANKSNDGSLINRASNSMVDLSSYLSVLQSIVKGLASRQISVMISIHTLNTDQDGKENALWYNAKLPFSNFLKAIDMLTTTLCSDNYWNVLGIDVKNEPWQATWGTNGTDDFQSAAETIGSRVLQGCPQWLVFVEGVNSQHSITLDGKDFNYYDWFGGGLQNAGDYPISLPSAHKLVYAPHYYTPAVSPQAYLYGGGTVQNDRTIVDYVELSDGALQNRVTKTMHHMFGYLNDKQDAAVLLGEFGGLYSLDAHPKKTTQRCTDYTMQTLLNESYAGGYVWSLNPESNYEFNPADKIVGTTEGLMNADWRTENAPFLNAMRALDAMKDLQPMPCFLLTRSSDAYGRISDQMEERSSSFSYSQRAPSSMNGEAFTRGSILDRDIQAAPVDEAAIKPKAFKGRIRRWPGVLLLVLIVGGSIAAIVVLAMYFHNSASTRRSDVQKRLAKERAIADGVTDGSGSSFISDDGQVNNPEVYPPAGCQLPNYQSKKGRIYAVAKNGTEVPVQIKGVNWFGMETGMQAPFGLWDNDHNGTTVYAIAKFLADNKFNSVRMPLCVSSILDNKPLEASIINRVSNRALDLTSYVALLQSTIQSLAYRQVSVMISMHTLDIMNKGGSLWYGSTVSVDQFLESIDVLTKALCSDKYWNVLGIDVKNEPWEGTWGTGLKNDFRLGAELIGKRVLKGCPNWLVFVEGVNAQNTITLDGEEYGYYDWFGGGLQKAGDFPVRLSTENKLVYAPHYYTPAVFPQYYLFGGGKVGAGNAIMGYVELPDDKLQGRVEKTMHQMFGYLNDKQDSAVVLGEFAGLYTKDSHPLKTTQRCTDFTIKTMLKENYAGGYMWSLNPESAYQYNPADTPGNYVEGLLQDDWRSANLPFLKAMKAMDTMPDLKMMPCFAT